MNSHQLLPRNRYYTLLQVGNQELARNRKDWDEAAYRGLLARHGATEHKGRFSASTMATTQLDAALQELKQLGFKPRAAQPRSKPRWDKSNHDWRAPRIKKLNAMWIALADAGVIKNRSEQAMHRWCENQVHDLTKLEWATTEQLNQAVEMMKRMSKDRGLKTEEH